MKTKSFIGISVMFTMTLASLHGGGLVGGLVREVGRITGSKDIKKAGDKLDDNWKEVKDDVHILGDIEEGVVRPIRETGKWIEKNPEEALAIAAVVAVGWAACADGCTFIGSLIVDGQAVGMGSGAAIAVPVIAVSGKDDERRSEDSVARGDENRGATEEEKQEAGYNPELAKAYPSKYSKAEHPEGAPIVLKYQSLDENLTGIFNEFAAPTYSAKFRIQNEYDPAGGLFESPRRSLKSDDPALSAFGSDARRLHAANDFLAEPGERVFATMSGKIEGIYDYGTFKYVVIEAADTTLSRVFYINPDEGLKKGDDVYAGKTLIGTTDDLSKSKKYQDVPNHVHVDFTDFKGRRFDPWTNKYAEPLSVQ